MEWTVVAEPDSTIRLGTKAFLVASTLFHNHVGYMHDEHLAGSWLDWQNCCPNSVASRFNAYEEPNANDFFETYTTPVIL